MGETDHKIFGASMQVIVNIDNIATAPLDGSRIQVVDMLCGSFPRWDYATWVDAEGAWFIGSYDEHQDAVRALNDGEISEEEYACLFHESPTHWAPALPLPAQ